MINDSLSKNKILSQSKWGSGKGEEEVTGLFITQVKTWLTYWKQPGSDFYKTKGSLSFPNTIQALLLNNVPCYMYMMMMI